MKNNTNKNTIIALLIVIIIILIALVIILATCTINFNSKTTENTNQQLNDKIDESDQNLTESEGSDILKIKFDFVEEYLSTFQNPCGKDSTIDDNIPKQNGMPYYRSSEFHSFEELNKYLLQYMSENIIALKSNYKKENYLEKDGNLYCIELAGGQMVSYIPEKTEYVINQMNNNSINATVTAYIESGLDDMTDYNVKRVINVTLTKNNENWQITKFEYNE